MLEAISFLTIVTAAITSSFVTRAQREVQSRQQQSGEDAGETVADAAADPRLEQMAARLERVESLLLELTKR